MDFVFRPTLKHLALTKIAANLWTNAEVLALLPPTRDYVSAETNAARNKVRRNARLLPLSDQLRDQLSPYIWSIWTQMSEWYEYLFRHFGLQRINPPELRWTPRGTIHHGNSVLVLLRDGDLAVETRFRLACNFCFAAEIPALMSELPAGRVPQLENSLTGKLVLFWTFYLTKEADRLRQFMPGRQLFSPAVFAFRAAVFSCNATAAQYLFENTLDAAEKKSVKNYAKHVLKKFSCTYQHHFDESIPDEFFPALARFLLSRLSGDEQTEVFGELPKQTLRCLMLRPYHRWFAAAVERVSRFISREDFDELLFEIFERIEHDYAGCEYRVLFRKFWNLGSVAYRKFVMEKGSFTVRLYEILKSGEEEICRMMVAALDEGETAALALDADLVACFYQPAIERDLWYELDFFLRQCALTKVIVEKIEKLMNGIFNKNVWLSQTRKNNFFRVLEAMIPDQQET